jgi:hypothetical protein
VEGSPPPTLTSDWPPASPPPRAGDRGGLQDAVRTTHRAPHHLASPTCRVAGEPAVPAGDQLTHPRPYNSPCAPTWASVVRGEGSRTVKSTRPPQQPAVIAADFTALYDRCLASGFKARVVFSYAAGRQTLSVSCIYPAPAETAAAAGKRCRRHRRRRRRGRVAAATPVVPARTTPSTAVIADASMPHPATPALPPEIALPPTHSARPTPSPESPDNAPPPVKKPRKRRNEIELLRECRESNEIFLSPPPGRESPYSPQQHSPPFLRRLQPCNTLS